MRTRFTLAQLIQRGYCLEEIDHIIWNNMASYGSKSGAIVVNIVDIHTVDSYLNDRQDKQRYRRR